jgi:hypothetical protein
MLKEKQGEFDKAIDDISKSLKKALKKYGKSHISVNKIRLQYAKLLERKGRRE